MTGSKYWGEEKYPDAIYSVFLKKVRYVSPPVEESSSFADKEPVAPDHLQWETIRERVIKAGTLQRLVESLLDSEGQLDSRQFNIFFATYRTFAKAGHVLDLIMEWYNCLSKELQSNGHKKVLDRVKSTRSTLKSILICWMDMYSDDFYHENAKKSDGRTEFALIERLIAFSKTNALHDVKQKARKLREYFWAILSEGGLIAQIPSIACISFSMTGYDPPPNSLCTQISPTNSGSHLDGLREEERYASMLAERQARARMFGVENDNVVQIAEQLTLWDALLFRNLKLYQCQGAIWGKRNKLSPNCVYSVRATIDQFNALCQRVMTSIVLPDSSPEHRAKIIEKWINIAKELRSLNNFSSLKAVLSSLQSQPIYRLKTVWTHISKASLSLLNELAAHFQSDPEVEDATEFSSNNFGENLTPKRPPRRTKSDMNVTLETTQGTCPYLGTFLTEFAMIDQAHSDTTEDGLINFEKRRFEFEILARLRLFQSAARAYTIPMDRAFCLWFHFLPALDEKECFVRSLEVEPFANGQQQPTPETARRKAREASLIPQMGKINSLSKIFSGLSSSPKELNFSCGNSTFLGGPETPQQHNNHLKTKDFAENRGSFVENGPVAGCSSSQECSRLSPAARLLEKPPKAQQRSRSQGSKKESRFNQKTLPPPPTPTSALVSSDSAQLRQENIVEHHKKSPSMLPSISGGSFASSSLCNSSPMPSCEQSSSGASKFSRFSTPNHSGTAKEGIIESSSSVPKDVLGRKKYFQKSNSSSSSSRSSMVHQQQQQIFGGGISPSSMSASDSLLKEEQNFHLVRVGLDDSLQFENATTTTTNYKCIKVINGDKMAQVVRRALEKHSIDPEQASCYCLVQLLPDGELIFPENCNPFYAVAPDPSSPMSNCILRKRAEFLSSSSSAAAAADSSSSSAPSSNNRHKSSNNHQQHSSAETKKNNKQKRSNLLRWSSGYLYQNLSPLTVFQKGELLES